MARRALNLFSLVVVLLVASITGFAQSYCATVGPSSPADTEIRDVYLLGDNYGISNPTTCPSVIGLRDFTQIDSADVSLGTSYSLEALMSTCGGVFGSFARAWIDYNGDGDFDDVGEELGTWSGLPAASGSTVRNAFMSFTVPLTATLGRTRIRVMLQESGSTTSTTPCATFTWGAVHDYTIRVTNTPPACPIPGQLAVSGVTSTEASLIWTSTGTAFDIEYGPAGYTQGAGTSLTSTTANATLTGLSANTCYDVYVRNNCSATNSGTSSWSGPLNFCTTCATLTLSTTETFATFPPNCWSVNTGSVPWTSYTTGGVTHARANFWLNDEESFIIESAPIDVSVPARVVIDWSHQANTSYPFDSMTVRVREINSSVWTNVLSRSGAAFNTPGASVSAPAPVLTRDIAYLPTSFVGDTVVLQVYGWSDYGPDLFVDFVTIEAQPACPEPIQLSAANMTSSTAAISWQGSASSYWVQWGPVGFTPGTGQSDTVSTNSFTIAGLTANTSYDYYVAALCGTNATSIWSGPVSFITTCGVITVTNTTPFSENFDAGSWNPVGNVWDNCWNRIPNTPPGYLWHVQTGGTPSFGSGPSAASSAPNYVYIEGNFGQTGNTAVLELPSLYIQNMTIPELSFDYHMFGVDITELEVLVSNDGGATFTKVDSIVGQQQLLKTAPWLTKKIFLSSYNNDTIVIRINHNKGTSFACDVAIDNVILKNVSCPDPVLSNTSVTQNSVGLSWVNNVGTTPLGSNILWGPTGFLQGAGSAGTWIYGVNSPYTLTGLLPSTLYDFYVIDSCGSASNSGLIGPITVKTDCLILLNGSYTIDPNGSGPNNFTSLDSAFDYLGGCGINGPVTFNIAAGTYTSSWSATQVVGSSATNTVSFVGASPSTVIINAPAGAAALLDFDGTSHVSFSGVTLNNAASNYVIRMKGNSNNLTFNNNIIVGDTTSTSSLYAPIVSTASLTSPSGFGDNANHITITNNVIKGGYYGIRFNGTSALIHGEDIVVTGNTFRNQRYYGMFFYYMDKLTIENNDLQDYRNTFNYGIYAYYVNEANVIGNSNYGPGIGIILGYLNRDYKPSVHSVVANNMCSASNGNGAYIRYARYLDMYHNTFKGSTNGCYILTSTGSDVSKVLDIRNNIFQGGTYAFFFSGSTMDSVNMDYNIYNSSGANLAYYLSMRSTLAAWQSAMPTMNANSSADPVVFVAVDDLHVLNMGPNNIGTPISTITLDIDGDVRSSTTPDVGADEYSPITDDAKLIALLGTEGGCGDSNTVLSIVFENFGINPITSMPATVVVTDQNGSSSSLTSNYTGNLVAGGVDTLVVGTINTYFGGSYTFEGYTSLLNDGRTFNDTAHSVGDYVNYEPLVTGLVDTVCASQDSVTLFAMNVPGLNYGWFTSLTDTNVLATGDSLTVPVAGQTSYFVKFVNTVKSATTSLAGGSGSSGNMFNIINTSNAPLTITGFAQGPGSGNTSVAVPMVVWYMPAPYVVNDPSWTQLASGMVVLTNGAATGYLPVNVTIPVGGTYGFFVGLTTGSVQYTNGTGTAGSSTWFQNNDFIITEGLGGSYPNPVNSPRNWNGTVYYGSVGCSEIRKEVSFAVNSDFAHAVGTATVTNASTGEFTFVASGSTGNQFNWNFGDGTSGSGSTAVHNYSGPGVFNVTLTVTDTVCGTSDDTTFTVTSSIGLDESALGQSFAAFPNPNTGVFTVRIAGSEAFEGQLEVLNLMGQVVSVTSVDKRSASLDVNLDLSDYAKGIYLVRLSGLEGQAVLRVVVR